jgi:predicted nuclease of predicted toxin-antitoxin system
MLIRVSAIAHDYAHALANREVPAIARCAERILITHDRDFGELIVKERPPSPAMTESATGQGHAAACKTRVPA